MKFKVRRERSTIPLVVTQTEDYAIARYIAQRVAAWPTTDYRLAWVTNDSGETVYSTIEGDRGDR